MIHILLEFYLTFHHTTISLDSKELIIPIIFATVIGMCYSILNKLHSSKEHIMNSQNCVCLVLLHVTTAWYFNVSEPSNNLGHY